MDRLTVPPHPFDPARAARILDALGERGFAAPDATAERLLRGAFGNSPYLGRLALRESETLRAFFAEGPAAIAARCNRAALAVAGTESEAEAMAALRIAKRQLALGVALADIEGRWPLAEVTGALSAFADAAVQGALRFLLRQAAARENLAE